MYGTDVFGLPNACLPDLPDPSDWYGLFDTAPLRPIRSVRLAASSVPSTRIPVRPTCPTFPENLLSENFLSGGVSNSLVRFRFRVPQAFRKRKTRRRTDPSAGRILLSGFSDKRPEIRKEMNERRSLQLSQTGDLAGVRPFVEIRLSIRICRLCIFRRPVPAFPGSSYPDRKPASSPIRHGRSCRRSNSATSRQLPGGNRVCR